MFYENYKILLSLVFLYFVLFEQESKNNQIYDFKYYISFEIRNSTTYCMHDYLSLSLTRNNKV